MSVVTKIEPIQKDIDLIIRRDLSPAARTKVLAEFAREVLGEAQRKNAAALGSMPRHETFVDGRQGAAEETVKPDGTIAYGFALIEDLLSWVGEQLIIYSPVKSGKYQRSHVLLADGVEVTAGEPIPSEIGELVFVNTQPYARKIESGSSPQAPDGVYEAVATLARRRFGNVARVAFSYRDVLDLGRQPAIIITVR